MRPAAEVNAAALSDLSEQFATIVSTDNLLFDLKTQELLIRARN